jgi:hypothetical protein
MAIGRRWIEAPNFRSICASVWSVYSFRVFPWSLFLLHLLYLVQIFYYASYFAAELGASTPVSIKRPPLDLLLTILEQGL